jgi:hypothetical protein
MRTIKIGERSSFDIRNANLIGFLIKIVGVGNAVNTDPVDVPYKARLLVKLRQAGFNETIVDGTVLGLSKGTIPRNEQWVASDSLGYRVVTAKAAGAAGVLEWTHKILFPTVINLNGDDVMTVEFELPSDALTTHDTATSYMGIKIIDGIGSQFYIPKIKEYILPALDTKYENFLGDNVLRVVFCGAATHTPIEDGLKNVEIYSDRRTYTVEDFELAMEALANESESIIVVDQEHDHLNLKCAMDGSTNAAGDLRMIVTDYFINGQLASAGASRTAKFKNKLAQKI